MDPAWHWLALAAFGVLIGGFGTLIGAGGGFILMPVLVLMYPREAPETLASISLAVVFLNAGSGSVGYAIQRKIDYRSGVVFALAGIPGAILGAFTTGMLPRRAFDLLLGVALLVGAGAILATGGRRATKGGAPDATVADTSPHDDAPLPTARRRPLGAAISFGVGFISSLLGIGGGIVHVPALVYALRFPVHIATATSHFVLAFTALTGVCVHIANGSFDHGWRRTAALGVGVVLGAQVGARLARRVPGGVIVRALAVALFLVGARVIYAGLTRSA